jgi:hypothetical protein
LEIRCAKLKRRVLSEEMEIISCGSGPRREELRQWER